MSPIRFILSAAISIIIYSLADCPAFGKPNANSSYYRYCLADESLPIERRTAYADSLMRLFPSERERLSMQCAAMCYERGDLKGAERYINNRLSCGFKGSTIGERCDVMALASEIFMRKGDFIKATAIADSLLMIPKPDSLLAKDMEMYEMFFDMNIHNPGVQNGFVDKAEDLYRRALKGNPGNKCIREMKSTLIFLKMRRAWYMDSINQMMEYSMILDKMELSPRLKASSLNARGLISMSLDDTLKAEKYFNEILSMRPMSDSHLPALVNLAYLYNQTGRYASTLDAVKRHSEVIQNFKDDIYQCNLLALQAQALAGTGDYRQAYTLLNKSRRLNDSIFSESSINKSVHDMEINTLEKTIAGQDSRLDKAGVYTTVSIAMASVFLLIALYLTWRLWRIKRQCRQTDAIHSVELARKIEHENNEKSEKEHLTRKLVGKTMKIESLEKALAEIGKIIGEKGSITSSETRDIRNRLRSVDINEDTWQSLSYHFENVDRDFARELVARHPDLTPGEKRLISYIMMNLTSKEIADLTNKSVRSIDSARYRLGKKLGLQNGMTLSTYLYSIAKSASRKSEEA